ncbi:helix-turn-helix domain-containing protein [Streptomyces sp. NPDC001581]|uniref:helix-turn-helix domain-containing protein n=1 Tax=Streptomyces sp. NPDC001581 TaxID=3154386 RepID=UPI003332E861
MWTKLSAATVPEVERFDWFNDVISHSLMPLVLASERSADFQADAAALDLGAVQVSSFAYSHVRSRRTPALIRRGDPELTPALIAAAHGISVRRLYLLFRDGAESVSATVRRLRLERCRSDLARPEPAARPVHDIAARWCFGNAAAFSRAFREAYGISPTAFRRAAAQAGPYGRRPTG